MIKCRVCGHEFQPVIKNHYVSRDDDRTGVATVISKDEGHLYDSFDCPACGCQYLAQERKRVYIPCIEVEEEGEDEAIAEAETD